jgi:hypothetical protein
MYLVIIILVYAGFIGLAMELYKKVIRKNKSSVVEIRLLALVLSIIFSIFVYKIISINDIFEEINNTLYIIILYSALIYLLQLPSCMKIWKPLLKDLIERKIK